MLPCHEFFFFFGNFIFLFVARMFSGNRLKKLFQSYNLKESFNLFFLKSYSIGERGQLISVLDCGWPG